jgi:hypothetical protein
LDLLQTLEQNCLVIAPREGSNRALDDCRLLALFCTPGLVETRRYSRNQVIQAKGALQQGCTSLLLHVVRTDLWHIGEHDQWKVIRQLAERAKLRERSLGGEREELDQDQVTGLSMHAAERLLHGGGPIVR